MQEGENMKKSSEAKIRAAAKYDKANTKSVFLKLNIKTDADILAYLETVGNKQGYIKELIRNDMQTVDISAEPQNRIIEGTFAEGEDVIVMVDGEKYKRKVRFSKKLLEPAITILSHQYRECDFE